MSIWGNTVCTNMLRTDYLETDPFQSSFLVNNPKADVDIAKETALGALQRSGGTMTGPIAMGGSRVTGLGSPSEAADAATKQYVDGRKATASVTLTASGWSSKKQTVSVSGVTASNTVLVTPAPASFVAYGEAVVYCSAQGSGTLTFTCDEVPTVSLTVNVLIMN